MTLEQRSLHRMIHARQDLGTGAGAGNGNGNGNGKANAAAVSPAAVSNTPSPSSSPVATSTSQKAAPTPSSSSTPPPAAKPTTTAVAPPTTSSSSSLSSSSSSSSSLSPSSVATNTQPTTTRRVATYSPNLATSSFNTVSQTNVDGAGSTITAGPTSTDTSAISAGPIVGGVIGAIAGIGILGMIIAFFLRRFKRSRRARPESEFGNFRRSAFVTEKSIMEDEPEMIQPRHNLTPSIGSTSTAGLAGYGSYQAGATEQRTQPASGTAGSAAGPPVILQERPKYVYGQEPAQQHLDDDSSEIAHGAYSSEPHMQTSYNPEAYGSYAKYDNAGAAQGGYQDAQREYQEQMGGYDQQQHQEYAEYAAYSNYDQNGQGQYAGYEGQAQQGGEYEQQQQVGQAQTSYATPHPYSTAGAHRATNSDAYGGM